MGRLVLLLLIIVAAVLVWKAFGPGSRNRNQMGAQQPQRQIKGPDDDEEFLWNLEKNQFKQRRAAEEAAKEEEERIRRARKRYGTDGTDGTDGSRGPGGSGSEGGEGGEGPDATGGADPTLPPKH